MQIEIPNYIGKRVKYKTPYFETFLYGFGTCTGIEGYYLALNIESGTTHVHLSLIVAVIN